MLRAAGIVLIGIGGFCCRQACLGYRRRQIATLEKLVLALRDLREGIRMTYEPMPCLLERLAEEDPFFAEVLEGLRQKEQLAQSWRTAAEKLTLSRESQTVWQWLGGQLGGDEQHVVQAVSHAERMLEKERLKLRENLPEEQRRITTICFSGAALTVILLL